MRQEASLKGTAATMLVDANPIKPKRNGICSHGSSVALLLLVYQNEKKSVNNVFIKSQLATPLLLLNLPGSRFDPRAETDDSIQ